MGKAKSVRSSFMTNEETRDKQTMDLLKVDSKHPRRLISRENSKLEYKQSFNWGSKAKYARTMAAFANNAGGFIVFGVKDSPHDIVGVDQERFERLDPSRVTEYLNSTFAPELDWEMFQIDLVGVQLGVIAVASAKEKPIVCIKGDGKDLQEAEIYYRYRGQSGRIRYPELQSLIAEGQRRERAAFLKHLRNIVRIGPENVGVLDLVDGKLTGHGGSLIVNQELLNQIQFIREGHFTERDEERKPTLRVVGEVEEVQANVLRKVGTIIRPMVIGQEELMLGFLRQEHPQAPVEYLRQACRESSTNMPIYHFALVANIDTKQLRELIVKEKPNRKALLNRLDGATIQAVGSLQLETPASIQRKEIFDILNAGELNRLVRYGNIRLFEAISHYMPTSPPLALMAALVKLVEDEFERMNSNERSLCRKAVAHLDEVLNQDECSRLSNFELTSRQTVHS
ncbi:MAG: ATP-binding protein [Bryobacterales bacterium]|nr:ATP-binding protein [Bryobacterales bacterium]MDE0296253.1 ATP-binding protein [Bryobacterales bacterium]